jgi:glycerophosphoryl diester phosphodiesterase
MEIIAHRGASHDAPENTLAAVNLGWQQGADAVEVDVQFSKDGRLVVIHDADTRKTAGARGRIAERTLAELRALDVGRWEHPKWAGERIPTLEEVLATVPDGKRLFVEIKCGPDGLREFVSVFKRSGRKPEQVVLIGFDRSTMAAFKRALGRLEVCWVVKFRRTWRGVWSPTVNTLIRHATESGLDGLDLGAQGPLDSTFAKKVHAAGLKLYVWTVDSPARARQLRSAGVDGLTTNRPGWLRARL